MSNKGKKHGKKKHPPTTKPRKAQQSGTVLTVIGLLIGLVGLIGLIALRTKMSVTPQEPIEKAQPFSVPFRIDNTGIMSFTVEHAFCYVGKVKLQTGGNSINLTGGLISYPDWENVTLESDGGGTLTCNVINAPNPSNLPSPDITIVIDYKPFIFPGSYRKYFRFTGAYVDNWQWVRKPVGEIQADIDKMISDRPQAKKSTK